MPREVGVVSRGHTEEGIAFCQGRVKVGEQRSSPVTRAVKRHVHADRVTIIDAPPGTACPMQEAVQGADYCVLVTEPTPFGVNDLQLAVETCRQLAVPCGVIINRDGIGDSTPVEDYCRAENLRLLLRILHERRIAQAYARGLTLAHAFPEWRAPLCQVFEQIVVSLSANPQSTGDNADATR
jgi:MinD superfamily P-loop ATPase